MLKKLLNNSFIQGGFIFSVSAFVVSFVNYLFNLLVARGFSLSDYGEYMSAMSLAAILGVPLTGVGFIVIKKIGSVDSKDRVLIALSLEKKLANFFKKNILAIILISCLLIYLFVTKANIGLNSAFFALLLTGFSLFLSFYASVLQSYKKFFQVGIFSLVQVGSKVLLGLLVVFFLPNLSNIYLVIVISFLLSLMVGHKMIKQKSKIKVASLHFNVVSIIKRKIVWLPTLASLAMMSFINSDIILVKIFFNSSEVGLYAALALMSRIIFFVVGPLVNVAFIFFSDKEAKQDQKKILLLSTALILAAALVAVLGYLLLPQFIIKLIFDSRYLEITSILWLAGIFGGIYSLINLFSQYFVSRLQNTALISLIFSCLQITGIVLFHQNFKQVFYVSIFASSALLIFYFAIFVFQNYYNKNNATTKKS